MQRFLCIAVLLAAAAPLLAQTPAEPQTPRELIIFIMIAEDRQAVLSHVTPEAQEQISGMDEWLDEPMGHDNQQVFAVGPVLMRMQEGNDPPIVIRYSEELALDAATVVLKLQSDEGVPVPDLQVTFGLKRESGRWMVVAFRPNDELRKRAKEGNAMTAIGSLRTLNTALVSYQAAYGQYTCELSYLGSGAGVRQASDAKHAHYIDDRLASGKRNGYVFRIFGCGPKSEHYRISAVPMHPGVSGDRAFCTDQDAMIYYADDGKETTCFTKQHSLNDLRQ